MDSDSRKYLPHGVTVNEFLERLEPPELEEIQSDIAYNFMKQLYEYFYLKKNEIKKAQKNMDRILPQEFLQAGDVDNSSKYRKYCANMHYHTFGRL